MGNPAHSTSFRVSESLLNSVVSGSRSRTRRRSCESPVAEGAELGANSLGGSERGVAGFCGSGAQRALAPICEEARRAETGAGTRRGSCSNSVCPTRPCPKGVFRSIINRLPACQRRSPRSLTPPDCVRSRYCDASASLDRPRGPEQPQGALRHPPLRPTNSPTLRRSEPPFSPRRSSSDTSREQCRRQACGQ